MKRKKSAAMRVRDEGAKVRWTTKQALTKLSRDLEARAGNDIFGWNSLAELVGSTAIKKSTKSTEAYDRPGGSASIVPDTFSRIDDIKLRAQDDNAPRETVSYNQRCIDKMMPQWVRKAIKSELKFLSPSVLAKRMHLPDDVHVKFG